VPYIQPSPSYIIDVRITSAYLHLGTLTEFIVLLRNYPPGFRRMISLFALHTLRLQTNPESSGISHHEQLHCMVCTSRSRTWTASCRTTNDSPVGDDSTSRIWSLKECREERTLTGNRWDIEYIEWHPLATMDLLVLGSKNNLITFWDPGTGTTVMTP